jgi:hypothetical protein
MKFPTDQELRSALERLPAGDEQGPRYRAQQQLVAREASREENPYPPEYWRDYLYRRRPGRDSSFFRALSNAGYDRLIESGVPFAGVVGLDLIDPILYDALVADELALSLPGQIGVRAMRYENPFWTRIFGRGTAEKAVSTTVEVIKVARDFGPSRRIAKADAAFAQATVKDRIAESELDVDLKRERLVEAQLRNERLALENAGLYQALGADQQRRNLIDEAIRRGQLDVSDALRSLEPGDTQALWELGHRRLELQDSWEDDDQEQPGEGG